MAWTQPSAEIGFRQIGMNPKVAAPNRLPDTANGQSHRGLRRSYIVLLLAAFFLAALAAATWWLLRPPALETVLARSGTAITGVYASGTVEASVMFPVAPRVGARLVAILRDEHAKVKAGDPLGKLEAQDVAGNLASLRAQADFAKLDYERYERLLRDNATTRQLYDRALATWRATEAAVAQARAQAGFMTLIAPDDCTVIARDGEVGQFIPANAPVFWLSCHSSLRISARVDEEDIPLVKPGQKVLIRADAFPGRIFQGSVTAMTPKGDPVDRSYRVRIALPADAPLQIGMTTEANIVARENANAVLLPASAVANGAAWKIVGDRAVRTPVRVGASSNGQVEIVQGLYAGDQVLRDSATAPADGRVLRLRQTGP